jgi:predicted DCC family thiol-disulfide oxidoreductase YuxK
MKIFYDAACPLCAKEMASLKASDKNNDIELIDIKNSDAMSPYPHIDPDYALQILHGIHHDGTVLFGLDVTYQAWSLVGRHSWLKVLRVQPVKWFADKAYLFFAKHRMAISKLLMPNQCKNGVCESNERK